MLGVVLLAILAMSAGIGRLENVIRANAFVLVDENGKTRAILSVNKDRTRLSLHDENGKPRAGMSMVKGDPVLGLHDENCKLRVFLSFGEDGPALDMYNKNGKVLWKAPL